MTARAKILIDSLQLLPHPEGGYYREIFRSEDAVNAYKKRGERKALTVIYFLLEAGQRSRWHCVLSDEAWSYLEGGPLELLRFDQTSSRLTVSRLGEYGPKTEPTCVVPAGVWQAAQPLGEYTLVSCAVGPGFDFNDFSMAADHPDAADSIRAQGARSANLI